MSNNSKLTKMLKKLGPSKSKSKSKSHSKSKSKSKSHSKSKSISNIVLKPHQQKVVNYMKDTDARGIILYHGLGSGKTITSIAISKLYPDKKIIIIVPASMRTQWKEELTKMKVNMRNYNVVSYEGFETMVISNPHIVESTIVILDEAHRIRNPGKTSTVINRSLKDCDKVILLTGTPMVNSPLDMSPLINVIQGNKIMPVDNEQFEDHFMITKDMIPPPLKNRCINYSAITCTDDGKIVWEHRCTYHYYRYMLKQPKEIREKEGFVKNLEYEAKQQKRITEKRENLKMIPKHPLLSEYARYVRCMVSYHMPDLSDDYPKVEKWYIQVNMSPIQSKIYNDALNNLPLPDRKAIQKGIEIKDTGGSVHVNTFLNVVRRVSNTWGGSPDTPKIRQIVDYIKKGPKPVIVYSNWLEDGINAVAKALIPEKISFVKFTGSLTDKLKNEIVKAYNEGNTEVLLLSSSGGEGIDLKNTRQIHIMEPHWNLAKINQVIGRGARYKSHASLPVDERKVTVYYWVSMPKLNSFSFNNKKTANKTKSMTRRSGDIHNLGADEYLYKIGKDKEENMQKFLETVVGYSIENNPKCLEDGKAEKLEKEKKAKMMMNIDMDNKIKSMQPKTKSVKKPTNKPTKKPTKKSSVKKSKTIRSNKSKSKSKSRSRTIKKNKTESTFFR